MFVLILRSIVVYPKPKQQTRLQNRQRNGNPLAFSYPFRTGRLQQAPGRVRSFRPSRFRWWSHVLTQVPQVTLLLRLPWDDGDSGKPLSQTTGRLLRFKKNKCRMSGSEFNCDFNILLFSRNRWVMGFYWKGES